MMRIRPRAVLPLFGFLLLARVQVYGASVDKDLEGIKKKIERERQGISQVRKRQDSVLQSLGQIENDLEKKTKELKAANSKLASIVTEIRRKESEAQKLRLSLDERRMLLIKRAAALYRWHRGGSPLVVLNGQVSPVAFLQRKRYLEATVLFDWELVQKLSDEAAYQENVKTDLARKKEEVDDQRRVLGAAKDSVRREADKRKELLASLRRETESRGRALKELEQAAQRLQKMMDEISRRALSKPREVPSGTGLEAMKGKLEWPVKGELTGAFGKARHPEFSTEVFRKGIDIEARIGEEIKAVEQGRVVFADRFSGYGKMLIIDHGERYFSIYAHLSEITKKNGEGVRRGETVGLVGDSDSLAGARLYFEMRKDGKSIDPLPWFRKQ